MSPSTSDAPAVAAALVSWQEGAAKAAITDFVTRVVEVGGPDYVAPAERIAVFDNDGTLWSEQPYYFQLAFALDQVRAMADKHPEWQGEEPFKSAIKGDVPGIFAGGVPGLLKIVAVSHSGLTTEDFERAARDWLASARHPGTGKLYAEMVFQPMLELLAYLRANGFKTFIVSGGGIEFIRAFAEITYGVPPEQVIGSSGKLQFEMRDDGPVITKLAELALFDDKAEKPCAIQNQIGRRPIAAFGNSDGDHEMLQWTAAGRGARLALLVHHTDAAREFAYEKSSAGTLDQALVEARNKGWVVVDMKTDWRRVFPFEDENA